MDKKQRKAFVSIRNAFLDQIQSEGPQSFADTLALYFPDKKTQQGIVGAFERLGLPLPQTTDHCMPGADGILIFTNVYGLVVRIEFKEENAVRPSQWVLQPLGTFDAGDAVVEICPACRFEDDKNNYHFVKAALKDEGINFWDTGLRNMGRLPVGDAKFPDGIPVVVDRRAVKMLSDEVKPVKLGLQGKHFKPLRTAFNAAIRSRTQAPLFLQKCEEFVAQGKMVAGWNDYRPLVDNKWEGEQAKGKVAGQKAAAYDTLVAAQRSFSSKGVSSCHR